MVFPAKDFPGINIAEEAEWKDSIQGSAGVVNLAGLPISTRWSPEVIAMFSSFPLFMIVFTTQYTLT